jgi:hypothetical protein
MEQFLLIRRNMKNIITALVLILSIASASAQTAKTDSVVGGLVTVNKDPRLDLLGKKVAEFNEAAANGLKAAKGYRLLVLSSNDRDFAMKVRAQLLQKFPEQKVYMTFQAPYIKLKFGNFTDKEEAEKYRKMLNTGKIVTTNIYLVPEMVEVKPDKYKEKDEE